jgi:hypothetical protein
MVDGIASKGYGVRARRHRSRSLTPNIFVRELFAKRARSAHRDDIGGKFSRRAKPLVSGCAATITRAVRARVDE